MEDIWKLKENELIQINELDKILDKIYSPKEIEAIFDKYNETVNLNSGISLKECFESYFVPVIIRHLFL